MESPLSTYPWYTRQAAVQTSSRASSIVVKQVNTGWVDTPRAFANARAVRAEAPCFRVSSKAAEIICSRVNLFFGAIFAMLLSFAHKYISYDM